MIPAQAIDAAKEAVREVTPPPGVNKADWLAEHGEFALIAGAIAAAAPHMLIHVHHHDIEHHARSFNEGYEAAVTQGLADDPSLADEWFQGQLREARAQALEEAAALAGRPENRWWAEGQNRAKWLRNLAAAEREADRG